jgi:hypothetical protein
MRDGRYRKSRDKEIQGDPRWEVQGRYIKINGKYREIRRNAGRYGNVMGWQI